MNTHKMKLEVEKKHATFVEEVVGLSVEQLKDRILAMVAHKQETMEHKDQNQKLKEVCDLKKEIEGPYKDTIKAIDLKTRYLANLVTEKGGSL